MRVYVPALFSDLEQALDSQVVTVRNGTAFALTPALRERYIGDDEELEHVAFTVAARASLRLIAHHAATGISGSRRVVISVDVPDEQVTVRPDLGDAVVRLATDTVPLRDMASVHVDVEMAEDAVATAAMAVHNADLGDEDAEFLVGDAEDYELAWYAPEELSFLIQLQ